MSKTQDQKNKFLIRVDREICENNETLQFERFYLIETDSAEKAQIMLNRQLIGSYDFNHFPDRFFADLYIVDEYHSQNRTENNAEIYDLLAAYEEENGEIPIQEGIICFDKDRESIAYPYKAQLLSEIECEILNKYTVLLTLNEADVLNA